MRGQWDEELAAAGNEMRLLEAQLTRAESLAISKRVDDMHLSYLFLSSDEAHLQRSTAWNQEARKYIESRDAARAVAHAADEVPTVTAREVLDAIGYDDPTVDPDSFYLREATFGGLGGSYPQDVDKSVDNRYVLLILSVSDAEQLAEGLPDIGGTLALDTRDRLLKLIARVQERDALIERADEHLRQLDAGEVDS